MIWSDMRDEIFRALKCPKDGTGEWTKAEILRRANMVMRQIVVDTACLKVIDTSLSTVVAQQEYTKPSGIIRICRVMVGTTRIFGINLAEMDMRDMMGDVPNPWQTQAGDTSLGGRYYETDTKLGLIPIPSVASKTISIEYIPTVTDLSADSDVPFNSANNLYHAHEIIINGVLWKSLLEDGNPLYSEYKSQFNEGVKKLKREILDKPDVWSDMVPMNRRNMNRRTPLDFWRMP